MTRTRSQLSGRSLPELRALPTATGMPAIRILPFTLLCACGLAFTPPVIEAQWTHRYPRVEGYGHHVYLEGYELPTLATGVMDPALSPDGRHLAFTSRGWIWVLDLGTGTASRVTRGGEMDFRPAWSPDGNRLALVRDTGSETYLVIVQAFTGREVETIRTPAIDLDPAFSPDGAYLYYSSAEAGTLDLWRLELATGRPERMTWDRGIQLRPQPHPNGETLVYLSKVGGRDQVRLRNLVTGDERVLLETSNASQARPALSPDGRSLAVNWPVAEGWELRLLDVETPTLPVFLTSAGDLPLAPAWSPDGLWIYFSHPSPGGTMELFRIPAAGGEPEAVEVSAWDWGEATGRIRIRTVTEGGRGGAASARDPAISVPGSPARLSVVDRQGHPALPDQGQPRFDGENGKVFFYSPGVLEVEAPVGEVRIEAVQGLATPLSRASASVRAGEVTEVEVVLEPLWDVRGEGWISGEHHFHLNYGGPFQLRPEALELQMAGEALDAATPLVANLHNRFGERDLWGWGRLGGPPFVTFGQEIRSHFLGHVALVGIHDLFWPWIWGPGYQLYGQDDRPNAEALRFGMEQGGIGTYVHPVSGRDPFQPGNEGMIPVGFIPDAVLGDLDALEVVCLWSNDLGTAELWYRILNLGIPLAANAGSDVMADFYRTMAVGAARVFVRSGPIGSWTGYLDALREGRSFVTTGPFLDFRVQGAGEWRRPGETVQAGPVRWSVDLRSPIPVERLEILVNGEIVHVEEGLTAPGARLYEGSLELPAGGWVAARAHGGEPSWPVMAESPFAHSSPLWIGTRGSTDPVAAARAARELLTALEVAESRLQAGYAGVEIPRLQARYDEARERLEARIR